MQAEEFQKKALCFEYAEELLNFLKQHPECEMTERIGDHFNTLAKRECPFPDDGVLWEAW